MKTSSSVLSRPVVAAGHPVVEVREQLPHRRAEQERRAGHQGHRYDPVDRHLRPAEDAIAQVLDRVRFVAHGGTTYPAAASPGTWGVPGRAPSPGKRISVVRLRSPP